MRHPRLRDGKDRISNELYPLGEFTESMIYEMSRWLVYNFAIGKSNISGEDWGDIFAKSIDGNHLSRPLGLADVVLEGQAWSVKSIQHKNPHSCKIIRVICGRNSPDYSYGIKNTHKDPQKTGRAVLGIWNERVNIALDKFDSLRTAILIRNINSLEFTLFETDAHKFVSNEYEWRENKRGNLEGHNRSSNFHRFTWQPHGSQFTIKYQVPVSAVRFQIKRPPVFELKETMSRIGFDKSWVAIK